MKRLLCLFLALCLCIGLLSSLTVSAATGSYSPNSGIRHQLCTALSDQAREYYTGDYSYANLLALEGASDTSTSYLATQNNPLYEALHDLMADTQEVYPRYSGYGSNALATYWGYTDAEGGEHGYLFFYTDVASNDTNHSMNREHVWPKSRASFYQSNGGADLHHLRPSIPSVNSAKSNYAFGEVVGVISNYTTTRIDGEEVIWVSSANDLLEVRDNIKGDVARIMLYVWCRWEQPNLYTTLPSQYLPPLDSDDSESNGKRVFESLETLLRWMEEDPVDEWEMGRNDVTESIQGNRNVFIDYPELAYLVFGQEVPADMPTPSNPNAEPPVQTPATVHYIVPEGVTCSGTTSSYVGSAITLPAVSGVPAGYTFYCWSFAPVEDTTGSVSGYTAGKSYTLTQEETTFYAVFYYKLDGVWHFTSTLEQVSGCSHGSTELRDAREPSCTEPGYSGDTYCTLCGELVDSGAEIPATGHTYSDGVCVNCGAADPDFCAHTETQLQGAFEPTCTKNGYSGDLCCANCGQVLEEGESIPATGHGETELRNAREATCTKNGYTGDTYCTVCNQKVSTGSVIYAPGHDYEDGVCTVCGAVEETQCDHENTELRNVVIGSCTKDGYSGDTYCLDCGAKIKSGTTAPANGHKYVDGRCTKCGLFEFTAVTVGECYFDDFSDCAAPWYHTAVDFTVANGLMKGIGDGCFDPNGSMTRAMIVTVLYRQAGSPAVEEPATFTDVPNGIWYSDAIAWAQDEGIVNGVSDTEFAPDRNVTREQIATILWRCSLSPELTADLSAFGDGETVSPYAQTAISWAVAKGILSGDGVNLNPGKNATRAEFACMILRYLEGSYTCVE